MKKPVLFLMSVAVSTAAMSQSITLPPSGDNQKATVTQMIGPVAVTIHYSSPDVHGRNGEDRTGHIWGELVPYGFTDPGYGTSHSAPWRAGANENTTVTFSHDVKVEGQPLKAGTYGLFLAVEKEGPWTWIFSKESGNWGHYHYDPAMDALRVNVNPSDVDYTEWLTFNFDDRLPSSATAYLQWEKKRAAFEIEVPDVNVLYLDKIRNELQGHTMGFSNQSWMDAARFCAERKINLEEALSWADYAISGRYIGIEDFNSLMTKAAVLSAMGRKQEATAIADKAIGLPATTAMMIHQYGKSLLDAGLNEEALHVFKQNKQKFPKDKFTPNVGLARAYTALGDKKKAMSYWETAITNLPPDQKENKKFYEDELKKLKD